MALDFFQLLGVEPISLPDGGIYDPTGQSSLSYVGPEARVVGGADPNKLVVEGSEVDTGEEPGTINPTKTKTFVSGNVENTYTATDGRTFTNIDEYIEYQNAIYEAEGDTGNTGGIGGIGGTNTNTNANIGMGGGNRAARDAAILLAKQYGFDESFFRQIESLLYEGISEDSLTLAIRQTDAYKKRFSANEARVRKGLPALSEAEYLNMEQLYRQELRAAGLPPTFYDDLNDFKTYIENDISYNEFVSRVSLAKRASQAANPEVKKQLKDLYGVGDSDLVGYFLNPEKTTSLLQRQFNVAQTAGALSKSGFGTAMAEELTTSVLGGSSETLNYGELEKSAQTAAVFRPLSGQVLGGERGAVSEADLLRGVVAQDVKSAQEIQKEQQRRLAEYQSGGSLAQAQQGIVGLRSAAR